MEENKLIECANKYLAEEKDPSFREEVATLLKNKDYKELEDRFYKTLEFGTGGLRGIMGGGTNRMNTLEIKRATQGLCNYILHNVKDKTLLSAVIAFDSRKDSDKFALATALIFAGNGIKAYLFTGVRPTPELSFAIRRLKTITGVVVTASHNPREYNGYKAYWATGGQVIPPEDEGIIKEVNAVTSIKELEKEEALSKGHLQFIDKEIDLPYWTMCKEQLFRPSLIKEYAKNIKIVYTPLHGTGAMHVEKVLGDLGLDVLTVPEQRKPNGEFPTTPKPNPEEAAALTMALDLAKKVKASCVMATDPDADRFGTAFPDENGEYKLVSGNQMGALFIDYIINSREEFNTLPKDAFIVRSIVTSSFGDYIAQKHNVRMLECLTGFKWIADAELKEEEARRGEFIFGLEESYGYKVEKEVMDKDGVSAAALCAEMTLYYKSKGKSILEHLDDLYKEYGYFEDRAVSKAFLGSTGGKKMEAIMQKLRTAPPTSIAGKTVLRVRDVEKSVLFSPSAPDKVTPLTLPKSNVLQFFLDGGTVVSARPSGTEPKIKFYINSRSEVDGENLTQAKTASAALCDKIVEWINSVLEE